MKKGKAILLAILGIGVLGALNYCLPVFSFGEVLAKEGVEWYRETEVWDFDARISYEPDAQKLLELLETLPVRRNIGDNHWRGKEHQREKGPQYAIALRYGKKGNFWVQFCEREVSFQSPGGGRFSDFDFNTYLIASPEDYEQFIGQLGELLEQSPSEPL